MLNYVWIFLMVTSLVFGAVNGKLKEVTTAAFESAGIAVDIALGLIGVMALWLGIMRIGEKAGLIQLLARAIRPITKRIFPDIPSEHPAMGAMILNIAANWLGLGNAATPFGIKAMEELQKLNPVKDTASNAMVVFLGVNTASITLIPVSIIAVRVQLGSTAPWDIIGTAIFASTIATITAVIMAKLLQGLPMFRLKPSNDSASAQKEVKS